MPQRPRSRLRRALIEARRILLLSSCCRGAADDDDDREPQAAGATQSSTLPGATQSSTLPTAEMATSPWRFSPIGFAPIGMHSAQHAEVPQPPPARSRHPAGRLRRERALTRRAAARAQLYERRPRSLAELYVFVSRARSPGEMAAALALLEEEICTHHYAFRDHALSNVNVYEFMRLFYVRKMSTAFYELGGAPPRNWDTYYSVRGPTPLPDTYYSVRGPTPLPAVAADVERRHAPTCFGRRDRRRAVCSHRAAPTDDDLAHVRV